MPETSAKKYLIEELFGDLETFDHILSRVLEKWGGQGAVIPVEAQDQPYWLFDSLETFTPFCKLIRDQVGGSSLCWECDLSASRQAAKSQLPVEYICDNGLLDIAVPILIDNQSLGTIVFGQRRLADNDVFTKTALEYLRDAEEKLGLAKFSLQAEWEKVPTVTVEEVEQAKSDVVLIAKFVSNIVSERRVLQIGNQRSLILEKELDKLSLSNLNNNKPVRDFWNTITTIFPSICSTMDVEQGVVLRGALENPEFTIHCSYPSELIIQGGKVQVANMTLEKLSKNGAYITNLIDFQNTWADHPLQEKINFKECTNADVACLLIKVEPDIRIIIILIGACKPKSQLDWLSLNKQKNLLELISSRIKYEYSAVVLLYERILHEQDRIQYIQDVSHQLVGPLGGIRAHCENLLRGRLTVAKGRTTLETIVEQAGLVQRYAINFGYVARQNGDDIFTSKDWKPDLATNKRLVEILVKSVKSFQGQAKARDLKGPSVDEVSFRNFPPLKLVPEFFEILILNLCDNAIKYSFESSPISIVGLVFKEYLEIEFTNHGIPLSEEEVSIVFKRHTRSKAAMEFSSGGSGIGLFLCDQICKLHGWTIRALPSKRSIYGNEVKFIVKIPLVKEK